MGKLTNKIVKIKKIQKVGENLMILIPKTWINELTWNRQTRLVLEFLPHRKIIILSELNLKDSIQKIPNMEIELAPINTPLGTKQRDEIRDRLAKQANEEVSDIVRVED